MDINSLLSPQDPPAQSSRNNTAQPQAQPTSKKGGRPNGGKRSASGL